MSVQGLGSGLISAALSARPRGGESGANSAPADSGGQQAPGVRPVMWGA